MKCLLFILLIFCLDHSAKAQTVFVSVPETGVAPFPDGVNRFVLVDLTHNGNECIQSLQYHLDTSAYYSATIEVTHLSALSWENITGFLMNDTNTELIVLEKKEQQYEPNPMVVTTVKNSYYHGTAADPQVYYSNRIAYEWHYIYSWKIYDLRTKSILGTYEYEYTDSSQSYAGKAFATRLLPHTLILERKYYATGNKDLRSASFLVRNDLWSKAVAMWERVSRTGWRVAKRRAFYNLAIAAEKGGDYPKAIAYVRQSQQLGEPDADFYILTLQNELKAKDAIARMKRK